MRQSKRAVIQGRSAHLGPAHADDAVGVSVGVVEEGDGDRMLAGRDPVAFGGGIDLEHMSSSAEDGLFPATHTNTRDMSVCPENNTTEFSSGSQTDMQTIQNTHLETHRDSGMLIHVLQILHYSTSVILQIINLLLLSSN